MTPKSLVHWMNRTEMRGRVMSRSRKYSNKIFFKVFLMLSFNGLSNGVNHFIYIVNIVMFVLCLVLKKQEFRSTKNA